LRLWATHHAVETFWKRLNRRLGLGQMPLRGPDGAWVELTWRALAYWPSPDGAATLARLTHGWCRQGTFAGLVREHFQFDLLGGF